LTLVSAPIATDVAVGPSDVQDPIMAIGVKATGSAMSIKKVDVRLTSATSGTTTAAVALPWKYFTNLYLYQGTTLIATLPVTSTSLVENNFGYDYTARFDGLNVTIAKDATVDFTVKADVVSTIPTTPVTYWIGLTTSNAIRSVDGLGLTQYLNDNVSTATISTGTYSKSIAFTNTSTGALNVITDAATPLAGNVATSTSSATTGIIGLVFDLQNTSNYDVTVKTINATVGSNGTVSAYYLYDGSTMIGAVGNGGTSITFSGLSLVVPANTTKVLTVEFDVTSAPSGTAIINSITVASAVDANYNIIPTGTYAYGNALSLQSTGVIFSLPSATSSAVASTTSVPGYATGTITFTVKANGVNLAKLSSASTTVTVNVNGVPTTANVVWSVNPDTALNNGSTATMTVTAVKTYSAAGYVKFGLAGVTFSDITPPTTYSYTDAANTGIFANFVTPSVWLQ
jgi:hypothetical protein